MFAQFANHIQTVIPTIPTRATALPHLHSPKLKLRLRLYTRHDLFIRIKSFTMCRRRCPLPRPQYYWSTAQYITQQRRNAMGVGLMMEADLDPTEHASHWILQGVTLVQNIE